MNDVLLVVFGMIVGFFACALMAAGHISSLEHALWRFSRAENWRRCAVNGHVAHLWNGGENPREMAEKALR